MVLAVQMMFDWLGATRGDAVLREAAAAVELGVSRVLKEGKFLTYDLGGSAKTSQVGDAVVRLMSG
jgi:isocitrate/isopropylmalate dehydrogenase